MNRTGIFLPENLPETECITGDRWFTEAASSLWNLFRIGFRIEKKDYSVYMAGFVFSKKLLSSPWLLLKTNMHDIRTYWILTADELKSFPAMVKPMFKKGFSAYEWVQDEGYRKIADVPPFSSRKELEMKMALRGIFPEKDECDKNRKNVAS